MAERNNRQSQRNDCSYAFLVPFLIPFLFHICVDIVELQELIRTQKANHRSRIQLLLFVSVPLFVLAVLVAFFMGGLIFFA
jgi:hypothetical protein